MSWQSSSNPTGRLFFFGNSEELIDKAKYYLAHPKQREEIRQAGLARARAEHTWRQRFEMVFEKIGLGDDVVKAAC